jgi:ubiquinone/menaquinone biosynthesis C-methylase UbiE
MTSLARAVLEIDPPPERLLEIECGEGEGTLFLAREYPRARVRGLERSEAAAHRARARVGLDPEGRVAFRSGLPRSLPFPDDNFDLVVQRRGRLHPAEAARVLRPSGHLILVGRRGVLLERRLRRRGLSVVGGTQEEPEPFLVARLGI